MSDVIESVRCCDREFCYQQIKANLPWTNTEKLKFLETYEIWIFFQKKKRWVSLKNLNFSNR